MGIRDRDLTISRMTERDPSLPHQVVIDAQGSSHTLTVSCNCRRKPNGGYDPIGVSADPDDTKVLYNDPDNHRKPFTEEDELKW